MKTLLLSLALLFLITTSSLAQQNNFNKFTHTLYGMLGQNADTILVYHAPSCIDEKDPNKCDQNDAYYIIWVANGINYIQRFDDCTIYKPIEDKTNKVLALLHLKFAMLSKEQIKPAGYIERKNGKPEFVVTPCGGCCYVDIEFYLGIQKWKKHLDNHDLNTKTIDDGYPHRNKNYDYNQHTYLKKLKDLIEQEVLQLYPKNNLRR